MKEKIKCLKNITAAVVKHVKQNLSYTNWAASHEKRHLAIRKKVKTQIIFLTFNVKSSH